MLSIVSVVAGRQHATKAAAINRSVPVGSRHQVVDWGVAARPYGVAMLGQLSLSATVSLGLTRDTSGSAAKRLQGELALALQRLGHLDAVVVYGDLYQSVIAARAASLLQIPIVHIEGGLRSWDALDDEESNRLFLDEVSTLHVTHCSRAAQRLIQMGNQPTDVLVTAPPAVATLLSHSQHVKRSRHHRRPRVLASLHRRAALTNRDAVENFAAVLEDLATSGLCEVLWLAYSPTRDALTRFGVRPDAALRLVSTLDYKSYVGEMNYADLVVTDSSGLFDDSFVFGQRLVVARDRTHRVAPTGASKPLCQRPEELTAEAILGHEGRGGLSALWRRPAGEEIWRFLAASLEQG